MSHAVVLVSPKVELVNEIGLEDAVAWEMEPFDENSECFADGSRWDWWVIGGRWAGCLMGQDYLRKDQLDLEKIYQDKRASLTEAWNKAQTETAHREFIYGVKDDESLDEFLKRCCPKPEAALSYYAFLSNRHWHEAERLGWFGMSAATECERKNPDYPLDNNKCLHKDEKTGARIVNWQEPNEIWSERFYQRFIQPLPLKSTLVIVDYHV